jgi:choice-of-anchor A domain-containing protein
MKYPYNPIRVAVFATFFIFSNLAFSQSPTDPALGFNVFTENNMTLITNESEGPIACGGDLTIAGNYQAAIHNGGNFMVNNTKIGVLVGGKINYESGNALQINQNAYIKIGEGNGSTVWYFDQNNAASPIRITPNANYNSSPRVMLQANANQLNVGVNNNPVFQSGLIDFPSAFQEMRTSSASIAQCSDSTPLTNPNGQSIPSNNLPNQVKVNLENGNNYLNINGQDMNNVQVITYNDQPSASKVLIVNVDAPGTFNWNVWNQAGVGFQNAPYVFYNFPNTTQLNIQGNSTVVGTIFAPFADVNKTANQSNIEGQVISKSLVHGGGEMHYAVFSPSISGCAPITGIPPIAEFNINNIHQSLTCNEYVFTNTSHTNGTAQPEAPLSYHWDFGDGTSSNQMNPTKVYDNTGTYTVTLTATNIYGNSTESLQVTVDPSHNAIVNQITIDAGSGSVTKEFTLTNSNLFTDFSWTLSGVGSDLYLNQNPVDFTFTQEGYYELKVNTTDHNGCEHTTIIPVIIESEDVNTGNDGGLESESLGDAVSKRYVQRKKKSVPTIFVKSSINRFEKTALLAKSTSHSTNDQGLLEMFPSELTPGNVANITSPTDILDYTIADEVLSVDFSLNGKTKAVVLGVKTIDKVYNHTKASCDRLKGAEIMNVKSLKINGYNFLMQAIKQRNNVTEYAVSFAVGKNNNQNFYSLQSNWYVNEFSPSNKVFNFQVWSTNPENTIKLVKDILNNLNDFANVNQNEVQKFPKTYAAKVSREGINMVLKLKSIQDVESIEITMDEVYSETNGFALRYNPIPSEVEQIVKLEINDGYEYDGQIKVNGEIQDVFYHADGNWGLDYDSRYTTIEKYTVSNNPNRVYEQDEMPIHRNVELKAHSEYDYLTLYKSLLPGSLSADYTEYRYLSFTARGSGLLELGLIKSSIEEWNHQYKANINVIEDEQTYYVPFDFFTSAGYSKDITVNDLTMLAFTFLPVEANTNNLDLTIEDVKLTKFAPEGYEELLNTMSNEFVVYPNPSRGDVNCVLYSDNATTATLTMHDITGKLIYSKPLNLTEGRNELNFNLEVSPGLLFFNISSSSRSYGTSKLLFQ